MLLNLSWPHTPSFDNFVTGANQEMVSALREFPSPDNNERIYIWGEQGSGRTHLLKAAAVHAIEKRAVRAVLGGDCLLEEGWSLLPGGLLTVDEVEALSASQQTDLFRALIAPRPQAILLAGKVPPGELTLREDLRTRISQMLIYQVQPLTEVDKMALLLEITQRKKLYIEPAVLQYLLHHGRRDLPALLGTLQALEFACYQQRRPATIPLLKTVMQQMTSSCATGN